MSYKHHYQFQNAKCFIETSDIFQNEGIEIMNNYEENTQNTDEEWSQFMDNNAIAMKSCKPSTHLSNQNEKTVTDTPN